MRNTTAGMLLNRSLKNVLLVDDEPETCQLISSLLKRAGAECVLAHSLAEGRAALAKGGYDAVFFDVNLPDGLGYELISEIKVGASDTLCVAISAMDSEQGRAVRAGADIFIPKPFDRETLFSCIRSLGFHT
ncbi:MAG TPA: response regulator [Flavobacteriales bacterium]|nr:response regulator [Flavobacteriales bacterium]